VLASRVLLHNFPLHQDASFNFLLLLLFTLLLHSTLSFFPFSLFRSLFRLAAAAARRGENDEGKSLCFQKAAVDISNVINFAQVAAEKN
jgi:hypothetical protein